MSDISQEKQTTQVPPQTRGQERTTGAHAARETGSEQPQMTRPSGWVGWVIFAAMMMLMAGIFQAIAGLTALFNSGYYVVGADELVVNVDYTAWGWTHLALGAIAIGAAAGLIAGQMWARVVGIAMAVVSAVVNLAFIGAYPLWSIIVITLDVVVIYAIAVHGEEIQA